MESDVPALVALLHLLFTQEADFTPDPAKQERGIRIILANPQSAQILVAREGEGVVGMVNLQFTISTAEGGKTVTLEDLIVLESYRGQGIGKQLLQTAIDFGRQNGFARILLLTDLANERAIRFYESHGFMRSAMTPLKLSLI